MPKVKPSWVCQNCSRPFTTKYSLMRHFKRFPEHAPPNLHDGADLKPITVTVDENVRTVLVVPVSAGGGGVVAHFAHGTTTPHQLLPHVHGTRNKGKGKHGSHSSAAVKATRRAVPVSAESHILPLVEGTPPPPHFGTPSTMANTNTGASTAESFHPTNGGFPFLPGFLEDDHIATPQHPSASSAAAATPLAEPRSPLAAHYSWMFTKDTTAAGPGGDLLSPLAPACNYGQVFSEESEEKLQPLATTATKKQSSHHHQLQLPRSPVELADLDKSLLLGDEEATSPFTFLEKTTTSLGFSSPGFSQQQRKERPAVAYAAANVRFSEELDFGFAF